MRLAGLLAGSNAVLSSRMRRSCSWWGTAAERVAMALAAARLAFTVQGCAWIASCPVEGFEAVEYHSQAEAMRRALATKVASAAVFAASTMRCSACEKSRAAAQEASATEPQLKALRWAAAGQHTE